MGTALGAGLAAAAAATATPPTATAMPPYAMAFRFRVRVQDLDLGEWQSCSGLRVDFKPVEVKAAGAGLFPNYLPGEVSFGRIVLKRVVEPASSAKLQSWLRQHGQPRFDQQPGPTAAISLLGRDDSAVMTWELHNARPAAWSGPDLDAMAGRVAVETLELVHDGFTVSVGTTRGWPAEDSKRLVMSLAAGSDKVTFAFAPASTGISRVAAAWGLHGPGRPRESGSVDQPSGVTQYTFGKAMLAGRSVRDDLTKLTRFATAVPSTSSTVSQLHRPTLTMSLGTGLSAKVTLEHLTVNIAKFDADGHPVLAEVGLTLNEVPPAAGKSGAANPSSGGIAGRRTRLATASDTLAGLAAEAFGEPGNWRELADANNVDDPLRLRPGTTLYLPAPAELGQERS